MLHIQGLFSVYILKMGVIASLDCAVPLLSCAAIIVLQIGIEVRSSLQTLLTGGSASLCSVQPEREAFLTGL